MFSLQFIDKVGRSCDQSEVPQIQFIVRAGFVGSEGVFGAFCAIFRAPPVVRS